jgi:gluconate 2-dehydrogenase gamma chain
MKPISRRKALQLFSSVPVTAAAIVWTSSETEAAQVQAQAARRQAAERGSPFKPKFFTTHEYATVTVLADLIIPRDERSGGASDAGVPEFMDFMLIDQPVRQTGMRGGLAFIDHICDARFDKPFIECTDDERKQVLDDLAYTGKVDSAFAHGAAFFSSFRDLTASGFWTSKMGIEDLQYLGNRPVAEWKGCPSEALEHLGVKYEGE